MPDRPRLVPPVAQPLSAAPSPEPKVGLTSKLAIGLLAVFCLYWVGLVASFVVAYMVSAMIQQVQAWDLGLTGLRVHWAANFGSSWSTAVLTAIPAVPVLYGLIKLRSRLIERRRDRQ